jgi:ParB-like nuclease domain
MQRVQHHGLIQPITVRPNAEGFELIAGARRYRAAQLAELFSIPARIVEIDDAQALEWQLRTRSASMFTPTRRPMEVSTYYTRTVGSWSLL